MAIKKYKRGSTTKLSKNFVATEFDCEGTGCCKETVIDEKLVEILQKIRDHFGKPIGGSHLTAYRCPTHNANVANAAKGSLHTKGMAADISIEGVKPAEIAKYAESIGVLGIGLYDTFVHIDSRDYKSFWYGHQQEYRSTFGGSNFTLKFPVLRYGSRSENVKAVQILLNGKGYKVSATGNFGDGTRSVVEKFQKENGLPVNGMCDQKTMEALLGMG